jgi:hypothetical protein
MSLLRAMYMFNRFPKTRPPLPKEIGEIYSAHYKSNREGKTAASSLAQRAEAWMHRQVAKDILGAAGTRATLEIGAGTLNQLAHEPERGPYDIVEPFKELFSGSSRLKRVRNIYSDIAEVPGTARYDRITSVATFEHVCNLPEVVARCGLLLNPNGSLRASIPSEGTPLWTLGWKLTTGLEFRLRHGLDYGQLMRHEHVNTAKEIEQVLRYFFRTVECRVFGVSKYLSLYQFYECKEPDLGRCGGQEGKAES